LRSFIIILENYYLKTEKNELNYNIGTFLAKNFKIERKITLKTGFIMIKWKEAKKVL